MTGYSSRKTGSAKANPSQTSPAPAAGPDGTSSPSSVAPDDETASWNGSRGVTSVSFRTDASGDRHPAPAGLEDERGGVAQVALGLDADRGALGAALEGEPDGPVADPHPDGRGAPGLGEPRREHQGVGVRVARAHQPADRAVDVAGQAPRVDRGPADLGRGVGLAGVAGDQLGDRADRAGVEEQPRLGVQELGGRGRPAGLGHQGRDRAREPRPDGPVGPGRLLGVVLGRVEVGVEQRVGLGERRDAVGERQPLGQGPG